MISNSLLLVFVFLAGFDTLLPVVPPTMEALTIEDLLVGGRISVKELVLLVHVVLNVGQLLQMIKRPEPATFVQSCYLFCVLGLASSMLNGQPDDAPQALRFLLAAYFAASLATYVRKNGIGRPLVFLSLGMIASGTINLYHTFTSPRGLLGSLPMLWGQNGPGGYAGFFVGMAFPLALLAEGAWTKRILKLTVMACVFIVLISYSKLGMMMAALGLLAWSWQWLVAQRRGRVLRFSVALLASLLAAWFTPAAVTEQLAVIYQYKFEDAFDESDETRAYYYVAAAEVALTYPLGASFTGTGAAFDQTWAGRTGRLPVSDDVLAVNPHNSFLAFLAADGWLGLVPALLMFLFWVRSIRRALLAAGRLSPAVSSLLIGSCVIFSNTLPGFFEVFFIHALVLLMYLGQRLPRPAGCRVAPSRP